MASTRAVRRDARISTSKQLRERLCKAVNQHLDTSAKRDRAQARVEALSIIADELRTQLGAKVLGPIPARETPARRVVLQRERSTGSSVREPGGASSRSMTRAVQPV